ncbi:MFS transporter [Kutzneria sp. 744]|uniref:MFS transporter n=1 Tax=Kutzneria sp. (strain 744) TaxID=345341 RepID=UPI0003EEBFC1|nr:MFS transporter [Kutzneria sp. 744]EWM17683.1 efflux transporter [Kutzneria sp. 744]
MFADLLRHRDFRWLTVGRTVSLIGNGMAPIALAFAVLDLTGSAADLGVVVAGRSLATVVVLLAGGVIADRLPRAAVLQGSSIAAGITQALVASLVLTGSASVPLLVVLSAVNGALSAVFSPASSALTPQTVPADSLRAANAATRITVNLAMIVGGSVAGGLVVVIGPGWCIGVDAVTFALAAFCYTRVRVPMPAREPSHVVADLREGWAEFTGRTWLWVIVAQFLFVNAVNAGGIQVLGPAIADATFGRAGWGLALAAETVGALAGGFVAARFQPRRALLLGVSLVLLEAVPLVTLAVAPGTVAMMVALALTGFTMEQAGVAWDISLQENIPADRLARVYSYDAVGSFVAMPLGQIVAGPAAVAFGARPVLLVGAVVVVVATVAALCSRSVRTVRTGTPASHA